MAKPLVPEPYIQSAHDWGWSKLLYLTLDMKITWLSTAKPHASDLLNKHGIEDDQAFFSPNFEDEGHMTEND
jgi:hypothetical protein